MVILCDIIYLLLLAFAFPYTLARMVRLRKYRQNLSQRLGSVESRPGNQPCIWIHAVSVGEVNATVSLIHRLNEQYANHDIVLSTTTETGQRRARELFPELFVFYYPLDFSWVVRRVLSRIRPTLIILLELEIWHNLVNIAYQEGVPIALANGRLSRRSQWKYQIIKRLAASMFDKLAFIAVQDEAYADRFVSLGADPDRIHVLGNMKYDTAELTDEVKGQGQLAATLGLTAQHRLLVAGSTAEGEEREILHAFSKVRHHSPELRLVLVPRKPQRFETVAELIRQHGSKVQRLSAVRSGVEVESSDAVILGDTMGDLRKFYGLAELVLVGRTFEPFGGSDVMEIAALGKAMIVGPHCWNFEHPVSELLRVQAMVQVDSATALPSALETLLADPQAARTMGQRAREVVRENQGASRQHTDLIGELLYQISQRNRRSRIQNMPVISRSAGSVLDVSS